MTKELDEEEQRKYVERILVDASMKPIQFSHGFLFNITNKFDEDNEIASGGSAIVYKGDVGNGEVAVKHLKKPKDLEKNFASELKCLIVTKHKNIVKFVGYCCADLYSPEFKGSSILCWERGRYLCFEYAAKESLWHYLEDTPERREWSTCYKLITGICHGLAYLHKNRMVHLDMKPANILLDDDLIPKITDFGLARIFAEDKSSMVDEEKNATPGYAAPEFLKRGEITFKTDIYSLGIIIVNILRGSNDVPSGAEKWYESVDLEGPDVKSCIEITQKCIDHDERERPTISEIIKSLNEMECAIEESSEKNNEPNMGFEVNPAEPYLPPSAMEHSNSPIIWSIEMHPTKPWIMTTSADTYVYIWNYITQEVKTIKIAESGSGKYDYDKAIKSAKFIAHKKWIVAGNSVGLLHVHSYEPEEHIRTLKQHSKCIFDLDVHATKPYVMSASTDGKVVVWNYEKEWEMIRSFYAGCSPSPRALFHPMVNNIIAFCEGYEIKLWNLDSDDCELTLSGHSSIIGCLSFFNNGGELYLISGSQDNTARIWDCKKRSCLHTLQGHESDVTAAFHHPDLPILITGSFDGSVCVWNSYTFRLERKLNFELGQVNGVAYLKGSRRIAIGHINGIALAEIEEQEDDEEICSPYDSNVLTTVDELFETEMGRSVHDVELGFFPVATSRAKSATTDAADVLITVDPVEFRFPSLRMEVEFSVNIVNMTNDYVAYDLERQDIFSSKYIMSLPRGVLSPLSSHKCVITRVALEKEQKNVQAKNVIILQSTIMGDGFTERDFREGLFEIEMGSTVHEVELVFIPVAPTRPKSAMIKSDYELYVWTIDMHPTEPWIMTTTQDTHVYLWNYETEEEKSIEIAEGGSDIDDYSGEIKSARFIARKKWIVAGSSTGLLHVHSYHPVQKIRTLSEHSGCIFELDVHETDPYVLSASTDGKILLWNYEKDWEIMKSFYTGSMLVPCPAFHPKDKSIIAYSEFDDIKVWNHQSNDCQHTLSGHSSQIDCLSSFRNDDKLYLISGSQDKTARIWNCETGICVQKLQGSESDVTTALCHPDVPLLMTGSMDGSVCLWNSSTFRLERILKVGLGQVSGISCIKGSTRIAIGHIKGVALVDIAHICSRNASNVLITVDPKVFSFPSMQREVKFPVNVVNITNGYVAYNLVPQDSTVEYTISLPRGVLCLVSTLECVITRVTKAERYHRYRQAENVAILQSTVVSEGLTEGDITDDLFKTVMGRTVHEVELVFVPTATSRAKSALICSPNASNVLITVDPMEFYFPSLQTEVKSFVNIVNITNDYVAYNLVPQDNTMKYTISLPRGVLSPGSATECVITRVTTEKEPRNRQAKNVAILQSTIVGEGLTEIDITDDLFDEMGRTVHEVELGFIPVPTSRAKSAVVKSDIGLVWTIQMHPTEPWVMTTSADTYVHIWNYQTKEVKSIKIVESGSDIDDFGKAIKSATFIAHKKWIVAGSNAGVLHVHSYDDPIQEICTLNVHSTSIVHLEVDAYDYVLSASTDGKFVLWSYENDWEALISFHPYDDIPSSPCATFHPRDENIIPYFEGCKIKFWSLASEHCELTLVGHGLDIQCLSFFYIGGELYLISGSKDKTARIWDSKTGSCVKILHGHESWVTATFGHPDLPVILTGSVDGSVYLWNSSTFRLESILMVGLGKVNYISCTKGSTRIAIGHPKGIAMIDIGPAEQYLMMNDWSNFTYSFY